MNSKKVIKFTLICALFFLALGGWFLHIRVHPISKVSYSFLPVLLGIFSVFMLPFLFWFKKTLPFAYILNGIISIIGTITMFHFSLVHFKGPFSFQGLFFQTTFPDIVILWAVFAIGYAIFNLEFLRSDADIAFKGRFFRYPNLGWWAVHAFALSAVYGLGVIFRK